MPRFRQSGSPIPALASPGNGAQATPRNPNLDCHASCRSRRRGNSRRRIYKSGPDNRDALYGGVESTRALDSCTSVMQGCRKPDRRSETLDPRPERTLEVGLDRVLRDDLIRCAPLRSARLVANDGPRSALFVSQITQLQAGERAEVAEHSV